MKRLNMPPFTTRDTVFLRQYGIAAPSGQEFEAPEQTLERFGLYEREQLIASHHAELRDRDRYVAQLESLLKEARAQNLALGRKLHNRGLWLAGALLTIGIMMAKSVGQ